MKFKLMYFFYCFTLYSMPVSTNSLDTSVSGIINMVKVDINNDSYKDIVIVSKEIAPAADATIYTVKLNVTNAKCLEPNLANHNDYRVVILHGLDPKISVGYGHSHIIKPCFGDFYGAIYDLSVKTQAELDNYDLINDKNQNLLVIPTEAGIDIYLYWNGKEYTLYYPPEIP